MNSESTYWSSVIGRALSETLPLTPWSSLSKAIFHVIPALAGAVFWWRVTGQLAGAGIAALAVAFAGILVIFLWKLVHVPAQMHREARPVIPVGRPTRVQPTKPLLLQQSQNGRILFDYSTNDGTVTVGVGPSLFPLKFSKASDRAIHFYRDGSAVVGVARVKNPKPKSRMAFGDQDSSSRVYTLEIGDVGPAENSSGFFLQLRIHAISDDTRGHEADSVDFSYSINGDGSSDFEALDR